MFLFIISFIFINAGLSAETIEPHNSTTTDFKKLVISGDFVDKTDIIRSFFETLPMKPWFVDISIVIKIYAPRGFGKSVNMDIIRRFCEMNIHENGTILPPELSENYKIFTSHNLSIYKDKQFFSTHFGKYPVIFLNFKILNCTSYDAFLDSFHQVIINAYADHTYLLNSNYLVPYEKVRFNRFYLKENIEKLDIDDLQNGISHLAHLIEKHFLMFKAECMIFIDEYDTFIRNAIFNSDHEVIYMIFLMYRILSTSLASNPYLRRALINASIRVGPIIPADCEKLRFISYGTKDNAFARFYGYTESEVVSLLEKHGMSDKLEEVRTWYKGYRIQDGEGVFYNQLSVSMYIKYKKAMDYWVKSVDIKHLKEVFLRKEVKERVSQLLSGKSENIRYCDKFFRIEIYRLKKIIANPKNITFKPGDVDLFLQLVTDLGYFNIIYSGFKDWNECLFQTANVQIKIPNKEVRDGLNSLYKQ